MGGGLLVVILGPDSTVYVVGEKTVCVSYGR